MHEILKANHSFALVPEAAENEFIQLITLWSESQVLDRKIPMLSNNMFYYEPDARDAFLDFINEISNYYYAGNYSSQFDPLQFPVSNYFTDDQIDASQTYFMYAYDEYLEISFIDDMRLWLDTHSIFYKDQYGYNGSVKETAKYINNPILEVW